MNKVRSGPWRNWYSLTCWRKRRAYQLQIEPLCRMCASRGVVMPATTVDHVEPHRGDWNKFRLDPVQSLCSKCHAEKYGIQLRGYSGECDERGWPIDVNHPANR
jgi:5-methylcytosine-specific restriction endonuclease McrA